MDHTSDGKKRRDPEEEEEQQHPQPDGSGGGADGGPPEPRPREKKFRPKRTIPHEIVDWALSALQRLYARNGWGLGYSTHYVRTHTIEYDTHVKEANMKSQNGVTTATVTIYQNGLKVDSSKLIMSGHYPLESAHFRVPDWGKCHLEMTDGGAGKYGRAVVCVDGSGDPPLNEWVGTCVGVRPDGSVVPRNRWMPGGVGTQPWPVNQGEFTKSFEHGTPPMVAVSTSLPYAADKIEIFETMVKTGPNEYHPAAPLPVGAGPWIYEQCTKWYECYGADTGSLTFVAYYIDEHKRTVCVVSIENDGKTVWGSETFEVPELARQTDAAAGV